MSPKIIRTYRNILSQVESYVTQSGGDMTRVDVQGYIHHMEQEGKKPTTMNNYFACISSFLRFQEKAYKIKGIRRPEIRRIQHIAPKALERNERNRLLREVERDGNLIGLLGLIKNSIWKGGYICVAK